MTKTMLARLSIVAAVLLALTLFALQSWGATSSTTSIEAVASRPVSAADAEPTAEPTAEPSAGKVTPASADGDSATSARQVRDESRAPTAAQDDDADDADADSDAGDDVTVTLLHNNDGESKLLPNIDGGFPGIARFAETWVELGRSSDADILLRVSAGDNFLASKEFAASLAREDQPLYDSIALRGLYEVMGLGNHDFDFGPEVTARFIEGFRLNESSDPVTFVAANIDVSGEPRLQALVDEGRLAPSTVVTDPTSGLAIGVIGALTPRLANISSPRNVIVDADVAAAVNAEAQKLLDQGVDRIVLVSHLQGLSEDQDLVPLLSNVDIVVAGGGDELLKNDGDSCQPDEEAFGSYPLLLSDADGNDVPVVTTPGGYRCIGRLDITFAADGSIKTMTGSSIGVPLDGNAEEFAMSRVEEPLAEALAELDASVIGTSDVDLDGRRNSVRTASSNVGELLADALLAAGQSAPTFGGAVPVIAIQNGGGIRNDSIIPAGDITEADTFDIAPFANFVVTGEVSRDRLKELLEVGVGGLPAAEGTFPQIAGFTLEVDTAEPAREVATDGDCSLNGDAGSRVRTVTLDDGTEIVRDGEVVAGDPLVLATIDFLANGGDCYPLADLEFVKVATSYQQALSSFIIDDLNGTISADDYPAGGARSVITSSEGAGTSADDDTDDAATTDDAETDELPNTGTDPWLVLIIALTVGAGGWLVFAEAQRAGWISLTNRLSATRAWFPDDD